MENTLIKITLTPPYPVSRFIRATSDLIRYHTDTAFADASIISPVFKGTIGFLINPDGTITVSLESAGGPEMNEFILEDYILDDLFENTRVTKYSGVTVLACKHFKTDTGEPLYLETDKPRPIDRLRDMVNEGKMTHIPQEEPESPQESPVYEDPLPETPSVDPVVGLLGGMLELAVKKNTLKAREELDKTADELQKSDTDFERVAGNNHALREKVENLKLRLDTLETTNESLNVDFSLTHIMTTDNLSESEKVLVKSVAKLLNVNVKYILHKLSDNIFHITLYGDDVYKQETLSELYLSDPTGSFTPLQKKNTFEYRGPKEYNLLIQSLLKRGFTEKEPEVVSDTTPGDNMFPPTPEQDKVKHTEEEDEFPPENPWELPPFPSDMTPVKLGSYQNESFVITDFYGTFQDRPMYKVGTKITDDYRELCVFSDRVILGTMETAGFVDVIPLDTYNQLVANLSKDDIEELQMADITGVVVRDYTGDIGFLVYDEEEYEWSNKFTLEDYICHQVDGFVCMILQEGTIVTPVNKNYTV